MPERPTPVTPQEEPHQQQEYTSILPERSLGIHRDNLKPEVRRYGDNLVAQVLTIFRESGANDMPEFTTKLQAKLISPKTASKVEQLLEALQRAYRSDTLPESARLEIKLQEAREAIGQENFLGPKEVEQALDLQIPEESIPEVPFSLEELKRAKALNHFLILRLDRFTSKELYERYNQLHANPQEPLLYDTDWYQNEDFYTQDKPKLAWALVSREVLPSSTDKNYLQQTQELIHYLKNQVYKDQPAPPDFNTWVAEFDSQKAALAQLITSNWQEAARKLSKLAINQHYRPSFADSLYDLAIYQRTHNQRLLPNLYAWTRSRSSDGSLVDVGPFRSSGLIVYGLRPVYHDTGLGLLVARSQ